MKRHYKHTLIVVLAVLLGVFTLLWKPLCIGWHRSAMEQASHMMGVLYSGSGKLSLADGSVRLFILLAAFAPIPIGRIITLATERLC